MLFGIIKKVITLLLIMICALFPGTIFLSYIMLVKKFNYSSLRKFKKHIGDIIKSCGTTPYLPLERRRETTLWINTFWNNIFWDSASIIKVNISGQVKKC